MRMSNHSSDWRNLAKLTAEVVDPNLQRRADPSRCHVMPKILVFTGILHPTSAGFERE
jgi:hypothetical protein